MLRTEHQHKSGQTRRVYGVWHLKECRPEHRMGKNMEFMDCIMNRVYPWLDT